MAPPALDFRPEPGSIPESPGCYQFKDRNGRVLYVGKAKSLRSRVTSYFTGWNQHQQRTRTMLATATDVDWIVVDTEVEALHLEYTLIQRHKPRFNIRYTDDKSYPYLVLTTSEEVPRAGVRRGRVKKDDRRFGPYAHAYAIRETLDLLLRVFPVRTCRQGTYDRAERLGRPCLLFHIDRCSAPCTNEISVEDHRALVEDLADFLDGRTVDDVLARLETEMRDAADHQLYEAAARLRDQLFAARRALEKQVVVSSRREDFDAVAVHEDDIEAAVQAFFVRNGRLVGRKGWTVDKVDQLSTDELLTRFLVQLYEEREDDVPPLVLVQTEPADLDDLELLLGDLRRDADLPQGASRTRQRVEIRVPQRGDKKQALEQVADNAREAFQRNRLKRGSDFNARSRALEELQEALGLDDAPLRIECVDISHLGGTEVVASMVVFEDGLPRKGEYRRFKLSEDKNDDYAAMREVFRRRFARLLEERSQPIIDDDGEARKFAYPPNLVIVDGGPGQLNAALAGVADVVRANDGEDAVPGEDAFPVGEDVLPVEAPGGGLLDDIAFTSLAKQFEELWLPGRRTPVVLPRGSEALYLVQRIRDEAHRFAITYQRNRRRSSVQHSALDDVPGIGPARRSALLERFGSAAAIRGSSVEDLMTVQGISRTLATQVLAHLRGEASP